MCHSQCERYVYSHDLSPYGEEEWGETFTSSVADFGLCCFEEVVKTIYVSTEGFDVLCFGETDEGYSEDEEEGENFSLGGDGGVGYADEGVGGGTVGVGGEGVEVLIESRVRTMSC